MARRGAPALYELLNRGREQRGGATGGVSVPNSAPTRRPGPTSIGPSSHSAASHGAGAGGSARTAAVPSRPAIDPAILRMLGIAAIGIAVLVGVYSLGVARGRGAADGSSSGAVIESYGGSPAPASPERAEVPSSGGGAAAAPAASDRSSAASGAGRPEGRSENPQRAAERTVEGGVGPALAPAQRGVDPRQAGLQYIVIASVLETNADKLVQFCRERGLDAWVVPDQNGRLREITVLPGIPKSELKGTVASELKSRIRKVGAQWKAAGRGNSDFEDHYFKPFNG